MNKTFVIENNIIKGQVENCNINKSSIGEFFHDTFTDNPDHIGQIDAETGKRTTYAEIKDSSVRLALWMKKEGIGLNDVVVICTPNHTDNINIISATFFVGAIYNPWDHELNLTSYRCYINLMKPKVIFSCKDKVDILKEAATLENVTTKIISLGEYPDSETVADLIKIQTPEEVKNFEVSKIKNPDDTVSVIVFTSGSTGLPKAIAYSYTNILKRTFLRDWDYNTGNEKNYVLTYMFPSWNTYLSFLLTFIKRKYTEIIHPNFDSVETSKIIEKYKVSILILHTCQLLRLFQENSCNKYNFDSVKLVYPVGTKINVSAFDEAQKVFPNAFINVMMGITETGLICCRTKDSKNFNAAGIVASNVQIKIVDVNTGECLGPNMKGELYVKTPTPMMGYFNDPELTKQTIDDEGWYHTGDFAYYDENGEIIMGGRLKDMIKYLYHDIIPADIEEILEGHSEVMYAAVIGVPHPLDIERPLAFVQKVPGSKLTEEDLVELLTPEAMISKDAIKFIDEMPRSTNGKIVRSALKEMAKKYFD